MLPSGCESTAAEATVIFLASLSVQCVRLLEPDFGTCSLDLVGHDCCRKFRTFFLLSSAGGSASSVGEECGLSLEVEQ